MGERKVSVASAVVFALGMALEGGEPVRPGAVWPGWAGEPSFFDYRGFCQVAQESADKLKTYSWHPRCVIVGTGIEVPCKMRFVLYQPDVVRENPVSSGGHAHSREGNLEALGGFWLDLWPPGDFRLDSGLVDFRGPGPSLTQITLRIPAASGQTWLWWWAKFDSLFCADFVPWQMPDPEDPHVC